MISTSSSCLVLVLSGLVKKKSVVSFTSHFSSSNEHLQCYFWSMRLNSFLLPFEAVLWCTGVNCWTQNGMHFLCISTVGLLGSCLPRYHLHLAGTNTPTSALPGLPNTTALHSRTLQLLAGAQHGEQQKQKILCKSTGETHISGI